MNQILLTPDGQRIEAPSGNRTTAKELMPGQTYLRADCTRYRTITALMEDRVVYVDKGGKGICGRAHFARVYPNIATEEEKRFLGVEEIEIVETKPELNRDQKYKAKLMAAFVRHGLEDFHIEHISDKHMKELNTAIRNSIATALHAIDNCSNHKVALLYCDWMNKCIPAYWEEAELEKGYLDALTGKSIKL